MIVFFTSNDIFLFHFNNIFNFHLRYLTHFELTRTDNKLSRMSLTFVIYFHHHSPQTILTQLPIIVVF